jgi:hypothetical protein
VKLPKALSTVYHHFCHFTTSLYLSLPPSIPSFPDIIHDMNRSGSVPRSEMSGSRGGEPNLNDVVDFLSSDDPSLVSNAASYLQHLAYGDDSMKSKIR